ncbi:siderophore-interacting protein [Actinoplanes couchii]
MSVLAVRPVGSHFIRVEVGGPGLASFLSLGTPDESVTLYFPRAGESSPPLMTCIDGVWGYHGLPNAPIGRNYTIRSVSPDSLVIDFARHGTGVASNWAENASPGDGLVLWRQRGWYKPPANTDWILLITDLTGLPAVARIVEQHDSPVPIMVRAVEDDPAYLDHPRVLSDDFEPPPGRGYVWFAGETSEARKVRSHWRDVHGFQRDQITAVGYWRAEAENWERRYAAVSTEIERFYQACVDNGDSITVAGEKVEEELARRGL